MVGEGRKYMTQIRLRRPSRVTHTQLYLYFLIVVRSPSQQSNYKEYQQQYNNSNDTGYKP
jgi:hypothetical protein